MGARRDFLNQALLDQRRSVYRGTIQPECYQKWWTFALQRMVRQCVNRGLSLRSVLFSICHSLKFSLYYFIYFYT